jgi:hypothetical protein
MQRTEAKFNQIMIHKSDDADDAADLCSNPFSFDFAENT